MTEVSRTPEEKPPTAKLITRLYADDLLIKETDDERVWCAVMNGITEQVKS